MSKHVEAEGGELLIRSSNGYMAIVPKNMASLVKEHISSGNHAAVDHYVKGLQEMKDGKKAEYGMKMEPPVKKVVVDKTYVAPSAVPMLGQAKPAIITETADITKMIPLVAGMKVMAKMFKKQK
jgi:hypothetical protein